MLKFTKTERQPPHSITACVDGCVQHSIDGSSGLGEGETGGLTPCACFSDLLSQRESGVGGKGGGGFGASWLAPDLLLAANSRGGDQDAIAHRHGLVNQGMISTSACQCSPKKEELPADASNNKLLPASPGCQSPTTKPSRQRENSMGIWTLTNPNGPVALTTRRSILLVAARTFAPLLRPPGLLLHAARGCFPLAC